jgi:hypothetical protein
MTELQHKFAALFAGRTDVVGTDTGGCVRTEEARQHLGQSVEEHWAALFDGHLNYTSHGIGIYPVMPDNTVYWGCVDIDTGTKPGALYETWDDAWQHSLLLRRVLAELSIDAWIERTRSRGAHVWVFAHEPVPARTMRRALIAAHQIADLPHKEINPKQETLAEGKVGNYVRLPYPYGGVNQQVIAPDRGALSLDVFVAGAYETRMPASTYAQVEDLYREPPTTPVASSSFDLDGVKHKSQYAAAMVIRGPLGTDRSAYLWRLARTLCEADVSFSDAWQVLCEADRRHGKFHENGHVEHLYRMLEKAYT